MSKKMELQSRKIEIYPTKKDHRTTAIMSTIFLSTIVIVSLFMSLIIPSLFAQSNILKTSKPQQFNLDAKYAYVGQGNPNDNYTDPKGNRLIAISNYPSVVYFNITRPSNIEIVSCDAIIEVYNVKITSDKGPVENHAFFTGTNYNTSFSDTELMRLTVAIYNIFDVNTVDTVSGYFRFNWTAGESFLSKKVGSFGTYDNSYRNRLGLWSAGKPNTVSMEFYRIGYVTIADGIISIQQDNVSSQNKMQNQLQEYGDGFLDNKIIPTDQLPQKNLFKPIN